MFINEILPIMIMQLCNLLFQCIYNKGVPKVNLVPEIWQRSL